MSGTGAVTSVGRNAGAACAAIRAGITRPRKLSEFRVMDPETQEDIPLTGHPLRGYTEGFSLVGRWMRLARGCVRDLLSQPRLPGVADRSFWEATGLMVAVAYPDDDVLLTEAGDTLGLIQDTFLWPLHEALGLPIPERRVQLITAGHAGTALALERAMRDLAERRLERVLVIAVDSYIHPLLLGGLEAARRLKTPEHTLGLMPGEAGICLLLETEASARRWDVSPLAHVEAVTIGQESNHLFSGARNMGRGFADCVRRALDTVSPRVPFCGDLFLDLNGENWRAHEWGCVQVHLSGRLGQCRTYLPCSSVGDIGAASGALGVCLAIHGWRAFHEVAAPALVLSSSDRGEVGCIALQPIQ